MRVFQRKARGFSTMMAESWNKTVLCFWIVRELALRHKVGSAGRPAAGFSHHEWDFYGFCFHWRNFRKLINNYISFRRLFEAVFRLKNRFENFAKSFFAWNSVSKALRSHFSLEIASWKLFKAVFRTKNWFARSMCSLCADRFTSLSFSRPQCIYRRQVCRKVCGPGGRTTHHLTIYH